MLRVCCGCDMLQEGYGAPIEYTDTIVRDTAVVRTGYASYRADLTSAGASATICPCRPEGNNKVAKYGTTGTHWILFALRIDDPTPAQTVAHIVDLMFGDGTTDGLASTTIQLELNQAGEFIIADGAAIRDQDAAGLVANTWHSILIIYTHAVSPANCTVKVYRDGNLINDATFVGPAAAKFHRFGFAPAASTAKLNPACSLWFSDIWMNDDVAGDGKTTSPGTTAYAMRLGWPIAGTPTYDEWDGSPSATKHENVDEFAYCTATVNDQDTTDNNTSTSSEKQTHLMASCTTMGIPAGDTIHGVIAWCNFSPVAAADDGKISGLVYADGMPQTALYVRTVTDAAWDANLMPVMGDTPAGNAWTQTLLNGLEVGYQTNASIPNAYKVTAVGMYVAADTIGAGPVYVPPATGGDRRTIGRGIGRGILRGV